MIDSQMQLPEGTRFHVREDSESSYCQLKVLENRSNWFTVREVTNWDETYFGYKHYAEQGGIFFWSDIDEVDIPKRSNPWLSDVNLPMG